MENVTIDCRCGDCVVGEEITNDGRSRIYCHTNLIYLRHEDFCSTGRARKEDEYYVKQRNEFVFPESLKEETKCKN